MQIKTISGRTQEIKVEDCPFQSIDVIRGVPQGAILMALLFVVFINDLTTQSDYAPPFAQADDAKLIIANKHAQKIKQELGKLHERSTQLSPLSNKLIYC